MVDVVASAGGPVNRRRGKDNELDISLDVGEAVNADIELEKLTVEDLEGFGDREGRNLANVFPFVGGDRGENDDNDDCLGPSINSRHFVSFKVACDHCPGRGTSTSSVVRSTFATSSSNITITRKNLWTRDSLASARTTSTPTCLSTSGR